MCGLPPPLPLQVLTWGISSQGQLGRIAAFTQEEQPSAAEVFTPKEVEGAADMLENRPTDIGGRGGKGGTVAGGREPDRGRQTSTLGLGGTPIVQAMKNNVQPPSGVGLYNTFAISSSGRVVGWGLNNSGQLGVAKKDPEDNLVWAPVRIDSLDWVGAQRADKLQA